MSLGRSDERGMALLTVMLLVAVMATVAVTVVDDLRFGLRRSGNAAAIAQARWYAIGAESFAALQLERLAAANPGRTTLAGNWNDAPQRFPIEGGVIVARLRDGGNCFNLNALGLLSEEEGDSAPGALPVDPLAVRQFRALLGELDLSSREAASVVDAVIDWTDSDSARTGAGWEDDVYLRRETPYRTGGDILSEVSELRAIAPITPELFARLRPFVCALPTRQPASVNVNTLRPSEDAILLTMATAGAIPADLARTILNRRPDAGWDSVDGFWAAPEIAALAVDPDIRGTVQTETRYLALTTSVTYLDAEVVSSALLDRQGSGKIVTRARRWTSEE